MSETAVEKKIVNGVITPREPLKKNSQWGYNPEKKRVKKLLSHELHLKVD